MKVEIELSKRRKWRKNMRKRKEGREEYVQHVYNLSII